MKRGSSLKNQLRDHVQCCSLLVEADILQVQTNLNPRHLKALRTNGHADLSSVSEVYVTGHVTDSRRRAHLNFLGECSITRLVHRVDRGLAGVGRGGVSRGA